LDAYSIKQDAPDPTLVCTSANSFVNALKNGALSSSSVKFGLGVPYGGFWEESPTNPNIPVLKERITTDNIAFVDCEASQSDCYNAMKPYFESNSDGMDEMDDVCSQMANAVRVARELEQSILRTRICQEDRESIAIMSECQDMYDAMKNKLEDHSALNCGGFGTGPGNRALPCDGGSGSAAEGSMRGGHLVWGMACASMGYLLFLL